MEGAAWKLPASLATEAPHQRRLFELLAGDKMGKDARRGVPYVWSVSHLADGHGWTSPRSFLAAIYGAAEDSQQRYAEHDINATLRDIRMALLDADVALPVVKAFVAAIRERALGAEVSQALNPGQQVVKIVNEERMASSLADFLLIEVRRLRLH